MYGFNPTLGSDYWNSNSSSSSSSGTDWKTDWNTVGNYSGLSGQPFGSSTSQSNSWNDFDLTKALTALGKSQRRKEYSNWGKQPPRFGFSDQNNRGQSAFPLGQDAVILPQQQQPFTVSAPQQSGGSGPFSTIGGLVGMGGTALGVFGPLGPAAGAAVGGLIDRF